MENLKPAVGTFCEVGAYDGVKASNTLLFEEAGWTGLCIEPDINSAIQCFKNRRGPTFCCAIGLNVEGTFNCHSDDGGLSGFNRPGYPRLVLMVPLFMALNQAEFENVDLLSIDTEGTELDVWDSIGNIRPAIVIMEYQTCDERPQDKAIVAQMTKDGYQEVHRTKHNLVFTR
jgi:FkbM family methyltransferase